MKFRYQCQKLGPPGYIMPTLRRSDISTVRQVPLNTNNNIFEVREMYGGQDVVYDTLFKQNRRVVSEIGV